MGLLTLADFRSELLFDLKNRSDSAATSGLTVTRQEMFIAYAYLHVTHPSVFRHRELQMAGTIPLVNGTNSYAFTPLSTFTVTGIRYVCHVAAATDDPTQIHTKLLPHDEQWFYNRTMSSGGPPRDYATRGNNLLVSPVPGANEAGQVLVVGAWREPVGLSLDTDVTELPIVWDEIILLAARWRAELHLGYRDLAEATKLDFVSLINEFKTHEDLHGEDWDWVSEVRTESYMESV